MSTIMIGLDTAKSIFQVHAVNESGKGDQAKTAKERADSILREAVSFKALRSSWNRSGVEVMKPETWRERILLMVIYLIASISSWAGLAARKVHSAVRRGR